MIAIHADSPMIRIISCPLATIHFILLIFKVRHSSAKFKILCTYKSWCFWYQEICLSIGSSVFLNAKWYFFASEITISRLSVLADTRYWDWSFTMNQKKSEGLMKIKYPWYQFPCPIHLFAAKYRNLNNCSCLRLIQIHSYYVWTLKSVRLVVL